MATLLDLELQESNNLIFTLMGEKHVGDKFHEDILQCMESTQLSVEDIQKVHEILSAKPETLSVLSDDDKGKVLNYWLKKKSIITTMHQKGYQSFEVFS